VEMLTSESVEPTADLELSVKLRRGILVGDRWREPGEAVQLPERAARELCIAGHAEPSGVVANFALFDAVPAPKKVAPVEATKQRANIRLKSGVLFDGRRSHTPESGPFFFPGDVVMMLAIQTAVPGSLMAKHVDSLPRNRPVIEFLGQLDEASRKRLGRLRKNPCEKPTDVRKFDDVGAAVA
jgi:hypothetical protein